MGLPESDEHQRDAPGRRPDVGRSCLLVNIGGKRVMLDCGMHMGYQDDRRFPDFNFIAVDEPLTEHIDAVIISHFHLDHCGILPYMTEMVGYNGKIYMTGRIFSFQSPPMPPPYVTQSAAASETFSRRFTTAWSEA